MQEQDYMRLVGERIRAARKRKGLSQKEFADLIGKDQRSVSQFETGERSIWIQDVFLYAQILDVEPTYFIQIDQPADANQQLLIEEFDRLPTDESKRSAIELLRAFAKALPQDK